MEDWVIVGSGDWGIGELGDRGPGNQGIGDSEIRGSGDRAIKLQEIDMGIWGMPLGHA